MALGGVVPINSRGTHEVNDPQRASTGITGRVVTKEILR